MTASTDGVRGSSVPSQYSEKKKKPSGSGTDQREIVSSSSRSTTDVVGTGDVQSAPSELQLVLAEAHVLLLAPSRQRTVAEALSAAGITAAGLRDLVAYTQHRADDDTAAIKILATIVQDAAGCAVSVRALTGWREQHEAETARQRAAQAAQEAAQSRYPGQVWTKPWHDLEQVEGEQRTRWERDRLARMAACRYRETGNREAVAAELGVALAEIDGLIQRGREMAEPPPWLRVVKGPIRLEPQESREDRVRRVREHMRKAKEVSA